MNSIKIALYGKKIAVVAAAFCSPSTAIATIKFEPCVKRCSYFIGCDLFVSKQQWKESDMVSAKWSDGTFYPAKIVKVISKGNRVQIVCNYTNVIKSSLLLN